MAENDEVPTATEARAAGRMHRVLDWGAPLILLYVFLHQMMGPAFFSSQRFLGVRGDTNQYMWYIGWIWHALETNQSPFVTRAFAYPSTTNIMDYTSVPLLGLLFGWLTSFANLVFIYNLIVILNYTLIYIFGKLTLRTLGIGRLFSSVGGLLFCLMPYLTAQGLMHLNLLFVAPLFVIGYLTARLVRGARAGWMMGLCIGLALAASFYTFLETFSTLILCLLILYGCCLLAAFKATHQFTVRLCRPRFLLGCAVPLLLIIPGVLNFIQGQGSQPLDFGIKSLVYSNDLLALVLPSQLYLVHTAATTSLVSHFSGNLFEWDGYVSIPFIILFCVSAVRFWRKPRTRILTYATVCLAVLSLGPILYIDGAKIPHVYLPWILLVFIPLVRDALPIRLSFYVLCLAIILVVWSADEWVRHVSLENLRPRAATAVALGAFALVALMWLPLLPSYTASMPVAASILSHDHVASRYIDHAPILVLYQHDVNGFPIVMGILAASDNYDLVTTNLYPYDMGHTTPFQINDAFMHDTDGAKTASALRQYLPQLGVGRVLFLSIDDQPISQTQLDEVSIVLGAPLYDSSRLVVVWSVPPSLHSLAPYSFSQATARWTSTVAELTPR